MTSVLLPSGADGVDAAGFARIRNFQPVADAGYGWISFYLGGTYGVNRTQIEAAWAAGLPVMLNFERAQNAALGGTVAGRAAAVTALSQGRALGFAGEAPLIFSGVDFGPTIDQFGAIDAYHQALADILTPEQWTGGAYGPKSYLQHLVGQDWWPATWPLWHWGGDGYTRYDWAWVKQWYGKKPTGLPAPFDGPPHDNSKIGCTVDENTLLKPMRFWSGDGSDPLDPQEDDMTPEQEAKLDALRTEVAAVQASALTAQGVFDAVLSLLRSDEIVALLHSHTPEDLAQIAKAVVAALPPAAAGGLTEEQAVAAVAEKLSS